MTLHPPFASLTRLRHQHTGGSFYDIIDMHGVASSTFYDARARTIKAINSAYADAIHFPWDDTAELQTISDEFYAANKQSLEGCVLAVDGLLVRIQQRTSRDTMNPVAYYTRKGFHALNVQAGCDARLRFRVVSIEHAGSTHDSLAWQNTNAAKLLQSGRLPSRFFFVADDAYVGHDQMLVPWPGRQLPSAPLNKDGYNYYQSVYVLHFPARSATLHHCLI